jgi:hypothetical protein
MSIGGFGVMTIAASKQASKDPKSTETITLGAICYTTDSMSFADSRKAKAPV